jgi:parvulin-like peptidyl-prolyl isomerase
MPVIINGEILPRELIREEAQRLNQVPHWRDIPDSMEKRMSRQQAAEQFAIDRVLLRQEAEKDLQPVDPALVENEVQRLRTSNGCRVVFDDAALRQQVERDLRFQCSIQRLMGKVPPPSEEDIARFYRAERKNFHRPEAVHAAHIVKHVDETHSEEEALAGIRAALAELESGEPFAAVAERHSDCKGNGGDLGFFPRGQMVQEFDDAVFAIKPGRRSPVFRTPFGFHIAEVRSKVPAGIAELSEVRHIIEPFLAAMNEQNALQRVTAGLRAKADIRRISTREAEGLGAQRATA